MFEKRSSRDCALRVLVLQSAIGDHERQVQWAAFSQKFTAETKLDLVETNDPRQADFVFLSTGGVEHLYIADADIMPGAIYAPKGTNAYAAMNEIRGFLLGTGREVLCYDENQLSLMEFATITRARRFINESRITIFGAPAPWLVASSPARKDFEARFKTKMEFAAWDDLSWPTHTPDTDIESTWQSLPSKDIDTGDLKRACQLSSAMVQYARMHSVDAITVGCFPLLAHHVSACLAVSDLLDAGYPAACENDICSVMAMMAADYLMLSSQPPWMANLVDINACEITLQHCTIAKSGLEKPVVMTHFESDANCAVAGSLPIHTPVTVFRFNDTFDRVFIAEGEIIESGPNPYGCRTSATIRLDRKMPTPLGNHHILIQGHHEHILHAFCKLFM